MHLFQPTYGNSSTNNPKETSQLSPLKAALQRAKKNKAAEDNATTFSNFASQNFTSQNFAALLAKNVASSHKLAAVSAADSAMSSARFPQMKTAYHPTTNPNWRQEAIPLRQNHLQVPTYNSRDHRQASDTPPLNKAPQNNAVQNNAPQNNAAQTNAAQNNAAQNNTPEETSDIATEFVKETAKNHDKIQTTPNTQKEVLEIKPNLIPNQDKHMASKAIMAEKKPEISPENKLQGDLFANRPLQQKTTHNATPQNLDSENTAHQNNGTQNTVAEKTGIQNTAILKTSAQKSAAQNPIIATESGKHAMQDQIAKPVWGGNEGQASVTVKHTTTNASMNQNPSQNDQNTQQSNQNTAFAHLLKSAENKNNTPNANGSFAQIQAKTTTPNQTNRPMPVPHMAAKTPSSPNAALMANQPVGPVETVGADGRVIISGNGEVQSKTEPSTPTQTARQSSRMGQTPAEQVALQVNRGINDAKDRITIQLKPAELGRVDIKLEVSHDGRMTAVISAERQETLDLLRSDQRNLLNAINEAGMKMSQNNLNFTSSGQNQSNGDGQHGRNGDQQFSGDASPEDNVQNQSIDPLVGPTIGPGETVELSEDGRLNIRV